MSDPQSDFVNTLLPYAVDASMRTGIDPRVIVGQAAVESDWGRRAPNNNLFGIKDPNGSPMATMEYQNGAWTPTVARFAGYNSPQDSVMGYADFINQNPRYGAVKSAPDLDSQIKALGGSGYATDPHYAAKVGAVAKSIDPDTAQAAIARATAQPATLAQALPYTATSSPQAQPASSKGSGPVAQQSSTKVSDDDLLKLF